MLPPSVGAEAKGSCNIALTLLWVKQLKPLAALVVYV